MKFIITESQHRRLLSEQKVYTSKTEYDKAMIEYNDVIEFIQITNTEKNIVNGIYGETLCHDNFMVWKKNNLDNIERDRKQNQILKRIQNKYTYKVMVSYAELMYAKKGVCGKDYSRLIGNWKTINFENQGGYSKNWDYFRKKIGSNMGFAHMFLIFDAPEKPIYQEPNAVTVVDEPNLNVEPVKTNFVIEFMWRGNRKLVYFNTYEDYSRIVGSVESSLRGNSSENASRSWARHEIYKDPSELGLGVKGKSDASMSIVFKFGGYKKTVWFKTYEEFNKICNSVDKSLIYNFIEDASGTWARCEIYASPSEFGL